FARLRRSPNNVDVSATFERNILQLLRVPAAKYAFGMALWAAAELRLEVPPSIALHIQRFLSEKKNWWTFRAQDLGMILTGVMAQVRAGGKEWSPFASPLFAFLVKQYHSSSGLFFDAPWGLRRRFASFASQTYLSIACYSYGETERSSCALEMANAC